MCMCRNVKCFIEHIITKASDAYTVVLREKVFLLRCQNC